MALHATSNPTFKLSRSHALKATPVFDTYWRFAAERQSVFMRRVTGQSPPWTDDPILSSYRFTNAYRAADRVSQYLIRRVAYEGSQSAKETVFRILLFKLFNRIGTWEALRASIGELTWENFDVKRFTAILDQLMARGECVYSSAYIMPSPPFGQNRKHANHLRLIEHALKGGLVEAITAAGSLEEVFGILRALPSLGDFLAFQFAIDLNYSRVISFPEADFVVAGPGAKSGSWVPTKLR